MTPFMISVLGISIPFLSLMIYVILRGDESDESKGND